jgi:protein SCO1/2
VLCAAPAPAQVIQNEPPAPLQGLDLVKKLGEKAPLELEFTDSTGAKVKLGQYFNQKSPSGVAKPVVLALVYYNCPMMCPLVLSRIQERLNGINYLVGDDFNVVVVSFDPTNTTKMAADNKAAYLAGYNKDQKKGEAGWTFHTSEPVAVRRLADAVGFPYRFVPETGQYAHPAALTVLTPDGRVSGYIDGMSQDGGELKLALLQASEGKIAKGIGDFFLHKCYRYDPNTGAYSIQATRVMQIGGFLTVAAVVTLLAGLRAAERARRYRLEQQAAERGRAPAAPRVGRLGGGAVA